MPSPRTRRSERRAMASWTPNSDLADLPSFTEPRSMALARYIVGRLTGPGAYWAWKLSATPAMVYTRNIRSIGRETAPFVRHGNVWVRDERLRGRVDVPATNAWTDDDGHGDYVLRCELLPVPPQRTSASTR